jgi:uncharacterized PurR-regulated membrane protein YhhQ (DUF165 family)
VLAPLLVTQVTLGVLTVLWRKPADIASLHVAVGALVLVTTFTLAARAVRVYGFRSAPAGMAVAGTGRGRIDRQNEPAVPVLTH